MMNKHSWCYRLLSQMRLVSPDSSILGSGTYKEKKKAKNLSSGLDFIDSIHDIESCKIQVHDHLIPNATVDNVA